MIEQNSAPTNFFATSVAINSNVSTVDGQCDEGWRHFNGHCYFIDTSTVTQSEAKSFCAANLAELTSVLDANEQSFIVGR